MVDFTWSSVAWSIGVSRYTCLDGEWPPWWISKSTKFYFLGVWRAEAHHQSKFYRNWSIHCGDIATFRFFKMADTVVFDFGNREFLLANGIERAKTHHHAEFRLNQSICYRNIAIFEFSRQRPPTSWIFNIAKFYWLTILESRDTTVPNFVKIVQSVAKVLKYFDFIRWRPSVILDFFEAYVDHPRRLVGSLYHYAKFVYDRCNSFNNMNVSIFDTFGWKTTITPPKLGFWGYLTP